MKRKVKYCSNCGAELAATDRFCGDCGFDTQSPAADEPNPQPQRQERQPIQNQPTQSQPAQDQASGGLELWRRVILLVGILIGLALFFYVTPVVVSLTAVNWEQEQAKEMDSISGYVSEEAKRLSELPLADYIAEKVSGSVRTVDSGNWQTLLVGVQQASQGESGRSSYTNRVSEKEKEFSWGPERPAAVFFQPDEIPYAEWGLNPEDGSRIYISTVIDGQTAYFLLRYHDYITSVSAMSKPYVVAPDWLYHPFRKIGAAVILIGLLAYILLPRRKKRADDITYSTGSMLAGDLVALILLLPFYGLPILINGGTIQAVTGMWVISAVMWFLALICIMLLYSNAWYASYRIILTEEALSRITFKGVRAYRFDEITAVNVVSLRNPRWYRKLFLILAFAAAMGGRGSTQPAGSALLAASAAYGGLEICGPGAKPVYIWFTNQNGGIIIRNFERLWEAIEASGIRINREVREIEGFSMFM